MAADRIRARRFDGRRADGGVRDSGPGGGEDAAAEDSGEVDDAGVDLALVPGTGPGGRIVRKDFDAYLKARATGAAVPTPQTPSTAVKQTKIIGVRRIIAERMQAAKQEIPHFSYVE